jgi:hypothetical protein
MITPAYSPTATERVLPRMALDFTTGTLDPRVTVTRALDTATRVNSSGFIESVNANLPRFDYSPSSIGTPRGLLIEETRANVCIRSSELNTGWSANGVSVGTNAINSPSGVQDADSVTASAGSSVHRLIGTAGTVTINQPITHTVFVKANTHSFFQIHDSSIGTFYANFNISTGAVTAENPVGGASITPFGNGWYRCVLTFTTGVATSNAVITVIPDGTAARNPTWTAVGTESIYAWGYQIEVGAFATSYIPTTTTSLTRNADAVSMTGTNFSDWYNASEGTLFAEASTFSNASTDKFVANINNNGFPNRILMNFTATNNFSASVVSNSVPQVSGTNGTATTLNTPIKMCFATKLNSFAFSQSGVAPTTSVSGAMPVTVDRLWIGGANTTAFLNGHMRQVKYWPQRLTNAEVQAFSK